MKLLFVALTAFISVLLLGYIKKEHIQPLTPACYMSCFSKNTQDIIAADALQPGFKNLHPEPNKFILENPKGKNIEYTAPDGTMCKGYCIKSKTKSDKWLFVIQEWWGLNDYIKNEADKYSNEFEQVNILAIDMYDGKVATTRDSAMVYMSNAKKERLEQIVTGALNYAGSNASVYTVGWCFGGGWSLQATILAGKQAKGCIMYYGRPENDIEKLKTINCNVIAFFGNQDKAIGPDVVNKFEADMKTAGKTITIHRYDAGHGFANPSNPSYNKAFTEDAHKKAVTFLKERL